MNASRAIPTPMDCCPPVRGDHSPPYRNVENETLSLVRWLLGLTWAELGNIEVLSVFLFTNYDATPWLGYIAMGCGNKYA